MFDISHINIQRLSDDAEYREHVRATVDLDELRKHAVCIEHGILGGSSDTAGCSECIAALKGKHQQINPTPPARFVHPLTSFSKDLTDAIFEWMSRPAGTPGWLMLVGNVGVGKSSVLASIADKAQEMPVSGEDGRYRFPKWFDFADFCSKCRKLDDFKATKPFDEAVVETFGRVLFLDDVRDGPNSFDLKLGIRALETLYTHSEIRVAMTTNLTAAQVPELLGTRTADRIRDNLTAFTLDGESRRKVAASRKFSV